jgi:hypothetical protein
LGHATQRRQTVLQGYAHHLDANHDAPGRWAFLLIGGQMTDRQPKPVIIDNSSQMDTEFIEAVQQAMLEPLAQCIAETIRSRQSEVALHEQRRAA